MTLLSIRVQLEVLELPKTSRLTFGLASYTLPSSYTLTTPFNTQGVINTVKLKLLSVF